MQRFLILLFVLTPISIASASEVEYVKVSPESWLNMRLYPSVEAPLVEKLSRGDELVVHQSDHTGRWALVHTRSGAVEGWVAKEFVTTNKIDKTVRRADIMGVEAPTDRDQATIALHATDPGCSLDREVMRGPSGFLPQNDSTESRMIRQARIYTDFNNNIRRLRWRGERGNETAVQELLNNQETWATLKRELQNTMTKYGEEQGDMSAPVRVLREYGLDW